MPLFVLHGQGLGPVWLGLLGVLGLVPAIDAAVAVVNRCVTRGFGATLLPALELRSGVPAHLRTLVAVPTLLTTAAAIEEQIERLEVHHLASPDGELHFALLSDWLDAATQHVDGDEALLETAIAGIARLNRRYGPAPGGDRFLLLHRKRLWNDGEARWIGWERKRGKLHELNRLLRGATDTSFLPIGGQTPRVPTDVRYVITLDADTRLPRDAVRRLIGKMAHPLNRPQFDVAVGRVVAGHAVLQPRVTPSLPVGREGSLFQRIFSSMNGIDPYAAAASDVYQDLIGEGSYAGQGHLRNRRLRGRACRPGARLAHCSATICSKASSPAPVSRPISRWSRNSPPATTSLRGATTAGRAATGSCCRGCMGRGPGVPAIGRWKMLDNLRRTLSAPACMLALLAGLALPFAAASVWIGFVLATILLPAFIPVVAAVLPRRAGITSRSHLAALGSDLRLALGPMGARRHVPGASGVADGRCNRANPGAAVRHPPASPRMGSGSAGIDRSPARSPRLLSRDGRRGRPRCAGVGGIPADRAWHMALGGAARCPLDRVAGDCALDQPASRDRRTDVRIDCGQSGAADDRSANLAVLRDLRDGSRQHAAAGQLPGGPGSGSWPTGLRRPISGCIFSRWRLLAISPGWER